MHRFATRARTVLLLLAATGVAAPSQAAAAQEQQPPPVFRSDVDVATLNVSIRDGDRPARDIAPGDLRVIEDGVERPVTFVLRPEDAPLDVAILLDASDSMARTGASDDALRLLDGLEPADCVLFLPFADGIRERLWASPGNPRLRRAIESTRIDGATRLYDALVTAQAEMFLRAQDADTVARFRPATTLIEPFDAFRFRPVYAYLYRVARLPAPDTACRRPDDRSRRRVILAVTDGLDTAGAVTAIDALRAGWSTETPVYILSVKRRGAFDSEARPLMSDELWKPKAVELGPGLNIDPLLAILDYNLDIERIAELLDHNLEAIAESSGGKVFWNRSYERSFDHALDWLRSYHVVGYRTAPRAAGESRRVRVTSIDGRLHVELSVAERSPRPTAETGAAVALATGLDELAQGRTDAAAAALARAATLDPSLGSVWLAQGLLELQQGRAQEALGSLRKALALAPWMPGPDFLLGSLYLRADRADLAWNHALHASALTGDRRLLEELSESGPPPADMSDRLAAPTLFLRGASMRRLALSGARAADSLLSRIGSAVRREPRFRLASRPGADTELSLLIRDIGTDAGTRPLDGMLVLTAEGREPLQQELRVTDMQDTDALASAVYRAVATLAEHFCDSGPCR